MPIFLKHLSPSGNFGRFDGRDLIGLTLAYAP